MSQASDYGLQALVVMDCQCAIIDNYVAEPEAFLDRAARTVAAARAAGIQVIYVVVGFRPGHPEIAAQNRIFATVRDQGAFLRNVEAFAIAPRIAPRDGDIIIEKHRVSGFEGTDLDMILRARGIRQLALCGVMTSGCVLSTVRRAADLDYTLSVIGDLCADTDPQVQEVLLARIFPAQADVLSADEWIAAVNTCAAGNSGN